MKNVVLTVISGLALLASATVSASADTDVWTASHLRSDGELYAANRACDVQFGAPQNGVPTSAAYKRCMASQGWKFVKSQHDDTWVNHRGMTCQPILGGFGSECSSF
jgi:hypothetical protein